MTEKQLIGYFQPVGFRFFKYATADNASSPNKDKTNNKASVCRPFPKYQLKIFARGLK